MLDILGVQNLDAFSSSVAEVFTKLPTDKFGLGNETDGLLVFVLRSKKRTKRYIYIYIYIVYVNKHILVQNQRPR